MMRFLNTPLLLTTAAIGLAIFIITTRPASTHSQDYAFTLVQDELRAGDGVVIPVRLVDRKTGADVPDAVIFATRLDMAPDGMPGMTAPLEALPVVTPGVYRFKTNLTMTGRWQLSLSAKLQGKAGSFGSKLVLKAVP